MTLLLDAYLALKPPNTARAYRPAIAGWLAWLGKEPARATQRDAAAYAALLTSASRPSTAAARLSACKSFHRWLVQQGLARANPFDDAPRPTVPRCAASRVLSASEVRRLNSYLDGPTWLFADDLPPGRLRDRALVGFLLATGRTPSEIVGLRWSDLLSDGDLWTLEDFQVVPASAVESLLTWHAAEGWIARPNAFIFRRRIAYNNLPTVGPMDPLGHISPAQITAIVCRVGRATGIDGLTPTALRNTWAAIHLATTGDLDGTARTLGHASTKTLARLAGSPRGATAVREFGAVLDALR